MKIDNNQLTRLFVTEMKNRLNEAQDRVKELKTLIELTQKLCPHDWEGHGEDPRNGRENFTCKICDSQKTV